MTQYTGGSNFIVSSSIAIEGSTEPGIVMSLRQLQRYMARLDKCKEPLSVLWLTLAGLTGGAAITALVGLITLPAPTKPDAKIAPSTTNLSQGTHTTLVAIGVVCAAIAVVSLVAYFTRRSKHADEVDELKKDMSLLLPEAKG